MAFVEGIEQAWDLVTVPDVAPLELRQGHVAAVDVVEDGGDFHGLPAMSLKESIAIAPVGVGLLTTHFRPSLPTP
jgi:hypothetical protein